MKSNILPQKIRSDHFTATRGSAILIAVGITAIVFTVTFTLSVVVLASFRSSSAIASGNKAYYAGIGAVEEALYMVSGHGAGFQYDSLLDTADDYTAACNDSIFNGFAPGTARQWIIESRTSEIPETKLAASDTVTLNLYRDKTCPYLAQPIDPTDSANFSNLDPDDFELAVYYKSADCPGPECPDSNNIVGDYAIALPDPAGSLIPVLATDGGSGRDVTVTDDAETAYETLGYERIDKLLEPEGGFQIYDSSDTEWNPTEALYYKIRGLPPDCGPGLKKCKIVESTILDPLDPCSAPPSSHPCALPDPGSNPFASNVSKDASNLFDGPPVTMLLPNLYIDRDNSGAVNAALAARWRMTALRKIDKSSTGIQYDIDLPLLSSDSAPLPPYDKNTSGNRAPDIDTTIRDLLDSATYYNDSLSLSTYQVPLYYQVTTGAGSPTAKPIPTSLVTISAQGTSGPNVQILQTVIEQSGTRPIFNRTVVF